MPEKPQENNIEKPDFLYHGSSHKGVEEFEPRTSKGTGGKFGAMVYATPDLATASAFLAEVQKEWFAGRFGDTFYVLIPLPREEFIKSDKGGHIYVLPSDTFESDPERGLGEYEWASKISVKPIKKIGSFAGFFVVFIYPVNVFQKRLRPAPFFYGQSF